MDNLSNNSEGTFKETIQEVVKRMCDKIFLESQYSSKFEVVDDDFTYPHITYFNAEGDALRINHITKFITFFPGAGLEEVPRTVLLRDIRNLLYALEGAALSIYAMEVSAEDIAKAAKPASSPFIDETVIEGNNLLELFTNLLARHQDLGTREHFQAELKKFDTGEK